MTTTPDIAAAERFLVAGARVIERRRFARRFGGGPAGPVRDAVAAYRNGDGGFGHALEPDSRTSASQPLATWTALRILHEDDAWDPALAVAACDWLASAAPAGGGAPAVAAGLAQAPHAPWMADLPGPSLISTGLLTGVLHARAAAHSWLDRATEVMWELVAGLADEQRHPYEIRAVLAFLAHVPDREAARRAIPEVLALIGRWGLVAEDPDAPGETHGPLDFAPRPDAPARSMFPDALIERHLDHLAAAQLADGGWEFDWGHWSPAAAAETRAIVTLENLIVLRAYGRV
ncbi:MAG: hypothetical protein AB7V42_15890 [Thermoleophilia bacterium]